MSNSIWKTPDQKPEEYETMLFESYEWGEPEVGNYQNGLFVPYNDESESLHSDGIEKWCYVDDLIAQADKAERLQKAVDYALQVLDDVSEIGGIDLAIMEIKQMIKERTNAKE